MRDAQRINTAHRPTEPHAYDQQGNKRQSGCDEARQRPPGDAHGHQDPGHHETPVIPIRQHTDGKLKRQTTKHHHAHEHGGFGHTQPDLDRKNDTQRIEGTDHQTRDASADHANLRRRIQIPDLQHAAIAEIGFAQRRANPSFRPGHGSFACSELEAREAIALNHGSLANIDDGIGRVLARLKKLGLMDNTVVMFTSDHGDLLGDPGLMFKGGLHYPALTRVPFIWRDPASKTSTGAATSVLTRTINIAPTVLARAGLAPANGMQGQSLLPLVDKTLTQVLERLLIEEESQRSDFGMDRRVRMRTLRDHQYRLTLYDGQDWGELVDLQQDPHELCNLWSDPGSRALRHALSEQLARTMLSMADNRPYPGAAA